MIEVVVVFVVFLLVLVLAYAATRPNNFRLERATTIKAPPEKVLALITDFRQWRLWSPWEKMDADLQRTYIGPDNGVGAAYAWHGKKAGAGRMEIVQSSPSLIQIRLDFLKPFEAHNTAEFSLAVQGDCTLVRWAMYGPSPFISKLMGIFFSLDKMVGKDFESGLENMKRQAQA